MSITSFSRLLFCLLISLSAAANAKTQLKVAEAFNIVAVNGTSYASGLISQDRELQLRDGKNLMVIVYEEVFESETDDDFSIVKSGPFLVSVYLKGGVNYAQKIVQPANADAARKFANNPLFEIVSTTTNAPEKAAFTIKALASDNKNFLVEQTRLRQNDTLVISTPSSQSATISPAKQQKPLAKSTAVNMLEYWWQQATPEERKAFLKSIEE